MIQRNVLADLNGLSESSRKTQAKASSGKEISRPRDDPFGTAQAMGLRQAPAANEQYERNIQDAQGWQDSTESALDSITDVRQSRPRPARAGRERHRRPDARNAIAAEIDQIIQGIKDPRTPATATST